jgi:hypothetical protein
MIDNSPIMPLSKTCLTRIFLALSKPHADDAA